jgi:hypothetical protein
MKAESLKLLREKLETRRSRLLDSRDWEFFGKTKRLLTFLHSNTVLNGALAPLKELWTAQAITGQPLMECWGADSDLQNAARAYQMLSFASTSEESLRQVQAQFARCATGTSYENMKPQLIQPLFDYLSEILDEQQVVLGYLLRYVRRCEWFDRARLQEQVKVCQEEAKAERKRALVEQELKLDLYGYLHDQGLDFVIEPTWERGEIDLIADQKGENPTYIEAKVFRGKSDQAGLREGFHQLFTYLNQYKAPTGYLAVYKLCEENLSLQGDGIIQTIPFFTHAGKTLYVLIVDLCSGPKSPSSQGKLVTIRVTKEELVQAAGT